MTDEILGEKNKFLKNNIKSPLHVIDQDAHYYCKNYDSIIKPFQICDGISDCPFEDDEENCHNSINLLPYVIYGCVRKGPQLKLWVHKGFQAITKNFSTVAFFQLVP